MMLINKLILYYLYFIMKKYDKLFIYLNSKNLKIFFIINLNLK